MKTVVLDTNVLLSDPDALFAYPDADVVIPETVLGELDKVKTARTDPDLRFRGRQVSRTLFELSQDGDLLEGVDLPDGGRLRVVGLDPEAEAPEGLSRRSADDRILAVAHQLCEEGCEDVTLVTNDLNMLLKAQTLRISVERHEDGFDTSFSKRYIVMPFQRYKTPLAILALALAVFAAIVFLTLASPDRYTAGTSVPTEFRAILSEQQETVLDLLLQLEDNPTDAAAMLRLANTYQDMSDQTGNLQTADLARRYYEQYLQLKPDDTDARTDLAIIYFTLGDSDRAIQEVSTVLSVEPNHINANYNLGIFYWKGRNDYQRAAAQMNKVIELTKDLDDHGAQVVNQLASNALASIVQEAEAAGQPVNLQGE
ncbi:MAG: hypothetical protein Kow0056_10810 [Coriobacteriia bacterium]